MSFSPQRQSRARLGELAASVKRFLPPLKFQPTELSSGVVAAPFPSFSGGGCAIT
jgi:hypothetical protein